jgi:hypothetical protein
MHSGGSLLFSGIAAGTQAHADELQGYFESYWNLETDHKPIRFGERDTKASLLDLARQMLQAIEVGVFHPNPGWQCSDCQFRSQCWAWR